jgi:hypothetical protein
VRHCAFAIVGRCIFNAVIATAVNARHGRREGSTTKGRKEESLTDPQLTVAVVRVNRLTNSFFGHTHCRQTCFALRGSGDQVGR